MRHVRPRPVRAPQTLAVDRDALPLQPRHQPVHPPHEARLELFRIQQPEQPAERVVRRHPLLERQPLPQPLQLVAPPLGHVHPVVGVVAHRAQCHQQHLPQRVQAPIRLARVVQLLEPLQYADLPDRFAHGFSDDGSEVVHLSRLGVMRSCNRPGPATTQRGISNTTDGRQQGRVEAAWEGRDLLNSKNGDLAEYSVRLLQRRGVRFLRTEPV